MKTYLTFLMVTFFYSLNILAAELPAYPPSANLQEIQERGLKSLKSLTANSEETAQRLGFESSAEAQEAKLGVSVRTWFLGCYGIRDYKTRSDWKSIVLSRSGIIQSITSKDDEPRARLEYGFRESEWRHTTIGSDKMQFKNIALLIKKSGKDFNFDTMGIVQVPALGGTQFFGYYDETQKEWMLSGLYGWPELDFEFGKTLTASQWMKILSKHAGKFCPKE